MNRLTTDNPHGNFETMMNFAYAKDGEEAEASLRKEPGNA